MKMDFTTDAVTWRPERFRRALDGEALDRGDHPDGQAP